MSRYNYRQIAANIRMLQRATKSKKERKMLQSLLWQLWRTHRGFEAKAR